MTYSRESGTVAPYVRPRRWDDGIRRDALSGLSAHPKTLPPKLFYDATGAALFERICELPEYYLTRTELDILRTHVADIASITGPDCALIEYGSGAGIKIRLLLDALARPVTYIPVDISHEQLAAVAGDIAADYADVAVRPVCADYTAPFALPLVGSSARRLAFFPGSTIGNFHPTEAALFLRRVRRTIGPDGLLILGVDQRKSRRVLERAYNDAAGVTAAFNRNILVRLNRELDATFNVECFEHRAFFNSAASRIEMHLVSCASHVVTVAGERIAIDCGETIWTENSYKYDRARLDALVSGGGFKIVKLYGDSARKFWVVLLAPAG